MLYGVSSNFTQCLILRYVSLWGSAQSLHYLMQFKMLRREHQKHRYIYMHRRNIDSPALIPVNIFYYLLIIMFTRSIGFFSVYFIKIKPIVRSIIIPWRYFPKMTPVLHFSIKLMLYCFGVLRLLVVFIEKPTICMHIAKTCFKQSPAINVVDKCLNVLFSWIAIINFEKKIMSRQ